jgi:hypothetical protein
MSATRKLINFGLIAVSAVAAPALAGGAPAFAASSQPPEGSTIRGVQMGEGTQLGDLTTCTESFSGSVTESGDAGDGFTVDINQFSFTQCDQDTQVTLNRMPGALTVDAIALWTIRPMDVDITTPDGTCRYTGSLGDSTGFFSGTQLRGTGFLHRQSGGCGGPESLMVTQAQALMDSDGDPPPM